MKENKQKLFVPYEIALLAKQHNFDYGCIAWYDSNTLEFNILGQENDPQGRIHLTAPVEEIIQVPMYQQLIDWFRDEQDIEITIMPVFRDKCGYDSYKREGYTYTILNVKQCQLLTWIDFNTSAKDRQEEIKEYDPIDRCLTPSLPNYYDVVNIAIKQAFETLKWKRSQEQK